jgi:hypothetical protein
LLPQRAFSPLLHTLILQLQGPIRALAASLKRQSGFFWGEAAHGRNFALKL